MEIIVEGKAVDFFITDQVIININFITKGESYEKVLELGIKNVELFVDEVLKTTDFNANDMKSRNFIVREETKYNELTRKYENDGYSFNQNSTLKFDYDKNKMTKIIEGISKLNNPPYYQISFGIKNEIECQRKLLKDAYTDAYKKAKAIAEASGKKLIECIKVDFKPFSTSYISQTRIGSDMMYTKTMNINSVDAICKTFTPEDIELSETLYCLWIAE